MERSPRLSVCEHACTDDRTAPIGSEVLQGWIATIKIGHPVWSLRRYRRARSIASSEANGLYPWALWRSELRSGYVSCGLGVLVSARGLLHQSKPSIEDPHVNTPFGHCKANLAGAEQLRSSGRQSR
jgi:hypothetical protein